MSKLNLIAMVFGVLVSLSLTACDKKSDPAPAAPVGATEAPAAPAAPATAATSAEHAPAGYKPGSHEDWCGGHGVPESVCTRCNPKLIPAFKATGDWCAEHGLPESQCKACNPQLVITRPPKVAQ